jgi:hypothetical protein
MQFSDLTNKEEVLSEGLFDKIVSASKSKNFDIDSFENWIKANEKPSKNPAKELIGIYTPDHVWNKRDFGKEVSSFPNAKSILSLTSNYKRIILELNKYQKKFDESYSKFIARCKEIAHEFRTDNFADAERVAASYVSKLNKARESELAVFNKNVEHYKPQLAEAVQEMKQYEAARAAARSKEEISNIKTSHSNKRKADIAYDKNEWKGKVKSLLGLATKKRQGTTGAEA